MTTTKAIEKKDDTKKGAEAMTLAQFLNSAGAQSRLADVASSFMKAEDLVRLTLMAASRQPELLKCAHHSILRALMDAAAMQIAPGGTMGRGYLVPRKNKKNGQLEASFDPGWRGLCDIAKRSGLVKRIDAKVVYESETFEYTEGTEPHLRHVPNLTLFEAGKEQEGLGRIVAAYAIAYFSNGDRQVEVLRKFDLERIRKVSAAQSGPWGDWYDEMARKSAVRRLCKYLPYDPVLSKALESGDEDGAPTTVRTSAPHPLEAKLRAKSGGAPVDELEDGIDLAAAPAEDEEDPRPAASPDPECLTCGKPVPGGAGVSTTNADGVQGMRHPDCKSAAEVPTRKP